MKRIIYLTGMKYACKGDMRLDEVLEYLKKMLPELILMSSMTGCYGVVVEAYETVDEPIEAVHGKANDGKVLRGMVSRLDLNEVLYILSNLKDGDCLPAKVIYVSIEGGFCALEVEVPEYIDMSRIDVAPSVWDEFGYIDAWAPDGMLCYEMFDDVIKVVKLLNHGFAHPEKVSEKVMMKHINRLMEVARYDVSVETQLALKRFRELVRNHPSDNIKSMHDTFVKEINDIGSKARIEEFRKEYFPKIKAELDKLREERMALNPDVTIDDQRVSAEKALRMMPRNLFLLIRDEGQFMHGLLYTDIPRKKLQMVIDAVCIYGWKEEMIEEEEDVNADAELFHFVHPTLEEEEAWRIHRMVKHLVSRFGVQEICDYLVELKKEKQVLLPQSLTAAYDELRRMGMPATGKGYDYKTFAKYYNK